MANELAKEYNSASIESDIQKYWDDLDLTVSLKSKRGSGRNKYIVHPPHLLQENIDLKDIYPKLLYDVWTRFQYMNDFNLRAQYGYDAFSLSIEQKALSERDFPDIDEFDQDDWKGFISTCQAKSLEDKDNVEEEYKKIGFFYDPKKFFSTYSSKYIDSVWWTIKNLTSKRLIKKERKVLPWCVECKAALPEIERRSRTKIRETYIVKFPVQRGKNRVLLVPIKNLWEMIGNVALAINPNVDYCVVNYRSEWGANKCLVINRGVEKIMDRLGIEDYQIINIVPGEKLQGLEYINPLTEDITYLREKEGISNRVLVHESIPSSLTGIFNVSPTTSQEAWEVAEETGLRKEFPLKGDGYLGDIEELDEFTGMHIDEASERVLQILKDKDLLVGEVKKKVREDFCVHCNTEVIHRVDQEWFLKAEDLKGQMTDLFEKINILPGWLGSSEYREWITEAEDWFITRRDGWGMPFPLWMCECGNNFVPESIEELSSKGDFKANVKSMLEDIRVVDIECEQCGKPMEWVGKTLNSLLISSASPWAQLGYPESSELNNWWPGDLLFGALGSKKGLFFGHLSMASSLFDDPPVETLVGHGELSLKYGNVEDIFEETDQDSLRIEFLSNHSPWEDLMLSPHTFERENKILSVLWNIYSYASVEMPKAEFKPDEVTLEFLRDYLKVEDEWILSKIESLKREVKSAFLDYRFAEAISLIEDFVLNDLAAWYMGLARNRLRKGSQKDSLSVLKVLHKSLISTAKILSPLAPYISEKIYQDLDGNERSVHLCDWPVSNRFLIDEDLHDEMEEVKNIIENIFAGKRRDDMPEKWPLKRIIVDADDHKLIDIVSRFERIIEEKGRIESIEYVKPNEEWDEMILKVHPNRNAIGRSYRQWASKIALMLEKRPAKEIKKGIDNGEYRLGIEGSMVEIQPNMVTFERELPEGFILVDSNYGNIYLDMDIDPKIWFKQIAHEIILRLKYMRYDLDLSKEDEMEVFVYSEEGVQRSLEGLKEEMAAPGTYIMPFYCMAVEKHKDEVIEELNAREVHLTEEEMEDAEYALEWEIHGEPVVLGITPLYRSKMIDIYKSIPGLSNELAETLYEEGYTSLGTIKDASASELSSIEGIKRSLARRIVQVVDERGAEFEAIFKGKISEAEEIAKREKEKKELIDILQTVDGIGPARAEKVYEAGYTKYEDFLDTDVEEFTNISHITVAHAKEILKTMREEYSRELEEEVPEEEKTEVIIEEEEEIEETEEEEITPDMMPEGVSRSTTYMIIEKGDEESIRLFREMLDIGMNGLLVTRQYPDKVKTKYGFEDVSIIWLSNVDRQNAVRPKNLEKFSLNIEQFLSERGGVILLNGMEYLITNNDFKTVLHLIQSLKDQVAINDSVLMIPVSPKTLDEHQLDLLESEVDEVITEDLT